jgi:hypothetical protein
MPFIKIAVVLAIISVVAAAATTHESGKSRDYSSHIGQIEQWDAPLAAPLGATGIVDLDLIY